MKKYQKEYQKEYRKAITDEQKQRYKEARNKHDKYRNMTDEERQKKKNIRNMTKYRRNMTNEQKERYKENKHNKDITNKKYKKELNNGKVIITIIKDNDHFNDVIEL